MNELSLFNSLFNDVFGDTTPTCHSFYAPRVDVCEDDNEYTLEMELPGRTEKDVNIELDHDNLTIESKVEETKESKEDKKDKKAKKYLLNERRYSAFSRRFTIPSDVDQDSVAASFKNGVLTISMKKMPEKQPKRIAIEAC